MLLKTHVEGNSIVWCSIKIGGKYIPSCKGLLELFTIFMKLSPSSVLIFSSVGVGIISNGAPSRALNIGVDCRASSVWVGGGLGVNRGQSDASSSY